MKAAHVFMFSAGEGSLNNPWMVSEDNIAPGAGMASDCNTSTVQADTGSTCGDTRIEKDLFENSKMTSNLSLLLKHNVTLPVLDRPPPSASRLAPFWEYNLS